MKRMTAKQFFIATGFLPADDDLERVNCRHAGMIGHEMCGWCADHNQPNWYCGCNRKKLSVYHRDGSVVHVTPLKQYQPVDLDEEIEKIIATEWADAIANNRVVAD